MKKLLISLLIAQFTIISCESINTTDKESKESIIYNIDSSDKIVTNQLIENIEKQEIDESEKEGLILLREEEKLARDVYKKLYEKWEYQIFSNISESEQTHMESIKQLLDRYSIEDPVKDDTIGKFTSEELQKIYNELVEKGSESLVNALIVGATVEDLDIKDLDIYLEKTDNNDIKTVYQNLKKGSRNHLRAFIRNLESNGGKYEPQYISTEDYKNIIESDQERGQVDSEGNPTSNNGEGNGKGNGNRQGKKR